MAEETPHYVAFVQSGDSTITDNGSGGFEITLNDLIPYFHVAEGEKSYLIPIEELITFSGPLNAAVVLTGNDTDTTSMVMVSNLSLSAGKKSLILKTSPLTFYEGEELKSFAEKQETISTIKKGEYETTRIYIEISPKKVENDYHSDCNPPCTWYETPYGNYCWCG